MPVAEMPIADLIGMILGTVLTLLILSYLLSDIPLLRPLFRFAYRLALHLFIGALVGYSFGIALRDIILPQFSQLASGDPVVVIPLILSMLLLIKGFRKYAYLGNPSIAYLVGVGVAVALSGALLGTLAPQIGATGRALRFDFLDPLSILKGLLIVSGTVCTLMAFNFAADKQQGLAGTWAQIVGALAWIGRWFLLFAFGVAFAGVLTASLSIFIGRIQYLIDVLRVLSLPSG